MRKITRQNYRQIKEELSLLEKILWFRQPDIFEAENIQDFQNHKHKIKIPWYKRKITENPKYYVQVGSASIVRAPYEQFSQKEPFTKKAEQYFFQIRDYSEHEDTYWNINDKQRTAEESFESLQKEKGLKEGVFVDNIKIGYEPESKITFIKSINLEKYDPGI